MVNEWPRPALQASSELNYLPSHCMLWVSSVAGKRSISSFFSDSMSSLQSLKGFKVELGIAQKSLKTIRIYPTVGKMTIFCWIPSHVNISGNQRADAAAKSAFWLPITNMKLPGCNLIPCVSEFCLEEWQDIWNCCPGNKLHAIYPTVGSAPHGKIPSCHEAVVINRLRLGHSRLTHSYLLLSGNDQPTLCVIQCATYVYSAEMPQFGGHPMQTLRWRYLFFKNFVWKCRQSKHHWLY